MEAPRRPRAIVLTKMLLPTKSPMKNITVMTSFHRAFALPLSL